MALAPNHRLNAGELNMLLELVEGEYGNALASVPVEKRRVAFIKALHAKLALQLKLLK